MNKSKIRLGWTFAWVLLLISFANQAESALASDFPTPSYKTIAIDSVDRTTWAIEDAAQAKSVVWRQLNIPDGEGRPHEIELVVISEDNTPHLCAKLQDRPLWQVTVRNWSPKLASVSSKRKNPYAYILDVWVDPETGRVLKFCTRWPAGVPEITPEHDAETGTRRMGGERYLGFPEELPLITFVEALDAMNRTYRFPFAAKQIVGIYVLWSSMGKPPKPVWIITLRSLPPEPLMGGGGVAYTSEHFFMRALIDPVEKRFLEASNTP